MLDDLTHKLSELAGKHHIGLELGGVLGRYRRHVESVADRPEQQVVGHLLGDLSGHVLLRLGGGGSKMRRGDQILHPEQGTIARRLLREHIERRAREVSALQRLLQCLFDDEAAARAIDQPGTLPRLGEGFRIDDVARRVRKRRVKRDEIRASEKFFEVRLFDAQFRRAFGGKVRIVGKNFIFNPCARSATTDPTLPQPMIPRLLPATSTPTNRDFSHLPTCVE